MVLYCLLDEINGPTASLENASDFLFQKILLKNSMSCPGCNHSGVPGSLLILQVSRRTYLVMLSMQEVQKHQNRQRSLWTEDRSEDLYPTPLLLEHKGTRTGIEISQMTGLSENTVSNWKIYLHTRLSAWLLANPNPICSPGVIVEVGKATEIRRDVSPWRS